MFKHVSTSAAAAAIAAAIFGTPAMADMQDVRPVARPGDVMVFQGVDDNDDQVWISQRDGGEIVLNKRLGELSSSGPLLGVTPEEIANTEVVTAGRYTWRLSYEESSVEVANYALFMRVEEGKLRLKFIGREEELELVSDSFARE